MAHFFLSQSHSIGIEMSGSLLRAAKMRKKRGEWEVLSLHEISSGDYTNLLQRQFKDGLIVSTLNSRDLLVRPCEIPLKKSKDLLAALDFHVEPLLPYPAEKGIIQIQINEQLGNSTSLSIFAIRKDHLAHHIERLKKLHLEPEVVTSKAHALAAFSTLLPQAHVPTLLVHEGDEEISFVLVEKGEILALRAIDHKKDLKSEIQKAFLNLSSMHKLKEFDSIYFLGNDPELKKLLQTTSGKTPLPPLALF